MAAEGNHHKRSCPLFRPYVLVNCKLCGVAGGPAWIMTSGRHHAWSCPRYSYSDAGECKFCGFVGEVSLVTSKGPHHARLCQRFSPGAADSPKVVVCKYCGLRGSPSMVTGIGEQHLTGCPRSTAKRAESISKPKENEGTLSSWFACLACCNVEPSAGGLHDEIVVKHNGPDDIKKANDIGEADTNVEEIPEEGWSTTVSWKRFLISLLPLPVWRYVQVSDVLLQDKLAELDRAILTGQRDFVVSQSMTERKPQSEAEPVLPKLSWNSTEAQQQWLQLKACVATMLLCQSRRLWTWSTRSRSRPFDLGPGCPLAMRRCFDNKARIPQRGIRGFSHVDSAALLMEFRSVVQWHVCCNGFCQLEERLVQDTPATLDQAKFGKFRFDLLVLCSSGVPIRKPAMVLPPSPKRRLRGKVSPSAINVFTKEKRQLTLKHAQRLLPNLYAYTKGAHFEAEVWLRWLRGFRPGLQLPSVQEASELLMKLSQSRRVDSKLLPAPAAWKPQGVRFMDEQGDARVQNLHGFEEQSGLLTWHEYGGLFRLRRHPSERGIYAVERSAALQRARAMVSRRTVGLQAGKKSAFKSSIVIDTLPPSGPVMEPQWSFIYLHSFSQKGTDYLDFPHYFNVCGANVRVVVPTAPLLEQQCFKDWYVWRGERLQWRRIKFNAWFDYLTDKVFTKILWWRLTVMAKALTFALSVTAISLAMSTDMADMDNALAADGECAAGQECALNALQQKAVVAQLQAEDSVEKFAAALEEGEEELAEAEAQSKVGHTASEAEKWGPSPPPPAAFNPYWGNPYGQMHPGFNPYGGSPYGGNPYSVPGLGVGGCLTKIQGSSCMVFSCAKSRGPTTCNLEGGVAENEICTKSLLAVRERLHGLLRQEVQRVGDPRRVIVGGASQGCCAALDAALTFEQ
ncbi:unnamed protein product, partial [Symbiodinium sp. KB8]